MAAKNTESGSGSSEGITCTEKMPAGATAGGADIVVVGGGMVGALTALAMAHCDLNVTVIEQSEPRRFSPERHDIRVSAISHATQQMFKAVGAWQYMVEARVCPYSRMRVWDKSSTAKTCFDSSEVGHRQLGFIVENGLIQDALWQQLLMMPNVSLRCPARVVALQSTAKGATLTLDDGDVLQAALLVAADGAQSAVRALLDIETDGEIYNQHAMVATVRTDLPQQDITWQRFTDTGPQAFLPLTDNRASLVWYNSEQRISELLALEEASLIQAIENEFPAQLGKLLSIDATGSFPLQWSHANQYVKPGVALVGDAAHAVHPLAGQGVNLGMLDAAVLLQCVTDGIYQGREPGDLRVLRRYERWRKPANAMMIRMLDGIQKAFQPDEHSSAQAALLKALRTGALNLADKVTPINKSCMRSAMGLSGELPDLAHGRLPEQFVA